MIKPKSFFDEDILSDINSDNAVEKYQQIILSNFSDTHHEIFSSKNKAYIAILEFYYFLYLYFQVGNHEVLTEEAQIIIEQFFQIFREILDSHDLLHQIES